METDATRMCALLVGLPAANVVAVDDTGPATRLRVHIETAASAAGCPACGTKARVKDRRQVALVDLVAFGRPTVLVWHKRRWVCPDEGCATKTFTEQDASIAAPKARVTDRAGRWMTRQVGRDGRTVTDVSSELGCDWHTVMDAVRSYGIGLVEDPARFGDVNAFGLDETLFNRTGSKKTRCWCTSIVGLDGPAQLLDVVEGRTAKAPSDWLKARSEAWRAAVRWGALDLSGPYRKTFNDTLPEPPWV